MTTPRCFPNADITALAAQARIALPAAVNGRIEKAIRLVQSASVELHADGSATVLSDTDGLTGYRVAQGRCTCPDFQFQPAEVQGWCCHRIARSMVIRLQQPHTAPTGESPATGEPAPAPDAPTGLLVASVGGAAQPLGEAPVSVNCYVQIEGRQVQMTLRGTDEAEVLARLHRVLQQYPVAAEAPTQPSQPQGSDKWCHKHQTPMRQTTNERGSWWSHKTSEGQWCKGR